MTDKTKQEELRDKVTEEDDDYEQSAKNARFSDDLREQLAKIQFDHWSDKEEHLPEISSCQQCSNEIVQLFGQHTSILFTQQQVEQMMNELITPDEISKARDDKLRQSPPWQRNQLRASQRQSIASIIKKYGGKQ